MRADTKRVEEEREENQPHQESLRAPFFSFVFTLWICTQDNCLENLYTRFLLYTWQTVLITQITVCIVIEKNSGLDKEIMRLEEEWIDLDFKFDVARTHDRNGLNSVYIPGIIVTTDPDQGTKVKILNVYLLSFFLHYSLNFF